MIEDGIVILATSPGLPRHYMWWSNNLEFHRDITDDIFLKKLRWGTDNTHFRNIRSYYNRKVLIFDRLFPQ